jgi:transcriptional regulator with AAA-type ATPase domain/transcriptional regulatory protein LevR
MTRKEKVLNAVREYTMGLDIRDLPGRRLGLDAASIGKMLRIQRNNVSKELALLNKEKILMRIKGKPVLYLDIKTLEMKLGRALTEKEKETGIIETIEVRKEESLPIKEQVNSLDSIVGSKGSLRTQVEHAKAAILYPPNGLHVILFGPTGVGKTMFAEKMYAFAQETEVIKKDAPFCVFNCADYADNPQLLLAQLFGYKKGAFTGADKDKEGLVEKAHEGILLLDEVHRLTVEGQEMLFHLLDKGFYRRLGETEFTRSAKVRIIAATTEDPRSHLLKTFLRRFPVIIEIPALIERPLEEKLRLIKLFFRQEAKNIHTPIYITPEVIHGLLLYNCPGNVGQLKADIQLICARAFLSYTTRKLDKLLIKFEHIPSTVKETLLAENYRQNLENLSLDLNMHLKIEPEVQGLSKDLLLALKDFYAEYERALQANVFKRIYNKAPGRDLAEVFALALEKFLQQTGLDEDRLGGFEESPLFALLLDNWDGQANDKRQKIVLAIYYLHLCYKHYENVATDLLIPSLAELALDEEFLNKGKRLNAIVKDELDLSLDHWDNILLGCFLQALAYSQELNGQPIGVLVLTHGNAQASSMLDIAKRFLGPSRAYHGRALDMPWETPVGEILEQACSIIREIDHGKGVLLMVDMGPLLAFAEVITKRTGILTKIVEGVNTSLVIQALGKALQPTMTLDKLVSELDYANPISQSLEFTAQKSVSQACILVSCITGHGTAVKLANLLRALKVIKERNIDVIPVNRYEEGFQDYRNIVAVVGTVDLNIPNVPFISVEEILTGEGLARIFNSADKIVQELEIPLEQGFEEVLIAALGRFLEFADSLKVYKVLAMVLRNLEKALSCQIPPNLYLRFMIHCGCMIERLIRGSSLAHKKCRSIIKNNGFMADSLISSFKVVEENFSISIPPEEYAYIIELLLESQNLSVSS